MKKIITLTLLFLLMQSCYFGMFLVEEKLPGNYSLWAENQLDQLKITHGNKDSSSYNVVIKETVFAVGFNKSFIIAKSFSKQNKKIRYHIIEVNKDLSEENIGFSFKDYKIKRDNLNLPYNLNFTLIYHEVSKN